MEWGLERRRVRERIWVLVELMEMGGGLDRLWGGGLVGLLEGLGLGGLEGMVGLAVASRVGGVYCFCRTRRRGIWENIICGGGG